MALSRRCFLGGAIGISLLPYDSVAQFEPFRLLILRERSIADILGFNDCIAGKMYSVKSFSSIKESALGRRLAHTLELPFRNNEGEISSIPPGQYAGKVRTGGSLGWRIELMGVEHRKYIQIHPGNYTSETRGCILVGLSAEPAVNPSSAGAVQGCTVQQSRDAVSKIRVRYRSANNSRPIQIKIID